MSRISCQLLKRKGSPYWQMRYRNPGEQQYHTKSLGVRDKQTAEKRRTDFITELERELVGITPRRPIRDTAGAPLAEVLEEFMADLNAQGRDSMYQENMRRYVSIPAKACGWSSVGKITPESFSRWRVQQGSSKSPRTLNHYFEGLRAFLNWLVRHERLPENPLQRIERVKQTTKVRDRRALTNEECSRLLRVAPVDRRLVYLLALHTGMRRAEMKLLEWRDVRLELQPPSILLRADTVKNGKAESIVIHPDLAAELGTERAMGFQPSGRVVRMFSRLGPFKVDLKAAGIPFVDDLGKRADLHALRMTFNTRMANGGVPTRIAMKAMRHSDERLTTVVYTDAGLLSVSKWISALPGFGGETVSPILSQPLGSGSHPESQGGTDRGNSKSAKTAESQSVSPHLSQRDNVRKEAPALGLEPRT